MSARLHAVAAAEADDAVFRASARISRELRQTGRLAADVFPLSNGYLLLSTPASGAGRRWREVVSAVRAQRTLVVAGPPDRAVDTDWLKLWHGELAFIRIDNDDTLTVSAEAPSHLPGGGLLFCLPQAIIGNHAEVAPAGPSVSVRVLGVGPDGRASQQIRRQALVGADDIIVFDRVVANVLQGLVVSGRVHILPYVYESFDDSVRVARTLLDQLTSGGSRNVTIVVEGNPEVLDLAPRVGMSGRTIEVIPSRPISLLGVDQVCETFGLPHPAGEYALLSGLAQRHPGGPAGLTDEIRAYLECRVPCLLVEMYVADWETLARALPDGGEDLRVVLMADMFSSGQAVWAGDAGLFLKMMRTTDFARGRLMSVLVTWGTRG